MKSAEEIMNMLEAFDLTGSCRGASQLAGVSHHTVARYVAARDRGVVDAGVGRPMLIDEFLPKVEEWTSNTKEYRYQRLSTQNQPLQLFIF